MRFGLHDGLNKSQIELLSAVRASQIKTFGWPIAVLLENRDEYRPRPFGDGIRGDVLRLLIGLPMTIGPFARTAISICFKISSRTCETGARCSSTPVSCE